MLILDTHIWVWWNQNDPKLNTQQRNAIEVARTQGIGICTISLVEIARLTQRGRVILPKPIDEWFNIALVQQGTILISITPEIAIDAASLPGNFHKDPADRLIVATARSYNCPLITADQEILAYPHVKLL
ncbi:MAG: type II toxin-antitoxin system VapC family toxin [Acaryochloris sp. RU_4_1]|nr:type II toxin-antitoxin system VapC family toxin [Acaryochloris sp. RU_4_1]NJR55896.1 type II toxin-antitoxin system VapC family toxin [Acaryochloris sp. CRU_2_0]